MRIAAAITALLVGVGFGVPCVFGIWHLARTGAVWNFLGYPTYGHGPFEQIGISASVPLLLAFLVVCLAEIALGIAIWAGASRAKIWSLVLLPFEFAFWIGFALPLGPPLGIARMVLLLLARR
ncbi:MULTISPECIES: hypothetical protein [unclassified Nocardiopsis]|uniref:hypothetical protein n=1 Tax=Nocardiopsis TaxID=2013 RepID=UPI00387A84DD